jgi:pilus assembly protein CpaE
LLEPHTKTMRALVASDDNAVATQLREGLKHFGHDCPASLVVALQAAPSTLSQLVGGGIAAAVPELLFVVISADVERSIGTLRTLRSQSLGQIFAVGPATDPKLVLRIMREGADEFLDSSDLDGELSQAMARLKSSQAGKHSQSRLISLLPASGGCGCSTLAASLATALVKSTGNCILLDLNAEFGDLASLLDLKGSHNIADLCQSLGRLDRALFEGALVTHSSGVKLLTAPLALSDAHYVTPDGILRILELSAEAAPIVVADLPHTMGAQSYEVLQRADVILLVLRLDFTSLRHARRLMDYLRDAGLSSDRIRVVVNRHRQAGEVPVGDAENALGTKIGHLLLDDPKGVNRANNNGTPIVLDAPTSKLAVQITALAASLQAGSNPAASPSEPSVVPGRWFAWRGS